MLNVLRLIGDVHGFRHGNIEKYIELTKQCKYSIQVGDLSFYYKFLDKIDYNYHKFIPGNHDNYDLLPNKHSLMNFGVHTVNDLEIFYVRGAWSIDGPNGLWDARRVQSVDYWDMEEISTAELYEAINLYEQIKPNFVITHEAPLFIAEKMGEDGLLMRRSTQEKIRTVKTKTSQALERMFTIHKPQNWYYGHYHNSAKYRIDNCDFRCLDELNYVDIEI